MSDVEEKKKLKVHIAAHGNVAACGDEVDDETPMVIVARESNCDECRAALLIALVKDFPVKGPPVYTPQPMENIESLEEIRGRRDGR